MKKLAEFGVCGHFGKSESFFDGQTIKTRNFTETLEQKIGENNVNIVDTNGWRKNPFRLLYSCLELFKKNKNIVMLPGKNGLKMFLPLFSTINKLFNRNLYYVVVGGWLPEMVKEEKSLSSSLRRLNCIFVETNNMKEKLEKMNFSNVKVLPNFKKVNVLKDTELPCIEKKPLKICTFSRVMKEKGIEEAIQAIIAVNNQYKKTVYMLDIYGQLDKSYEEEFKTLIKSSPSYISYKGVVKSSDSVNTLKNYFLMLFPTYYNGEGFAGTILDAFSSGLPVIASEWRYNNEIVKEGYTGSLVPIKNSDAISECLIAYLENINLVEPMRKNCIKEAEKYSPEKSIEIFFKNLN